MSSFPSGSSSSSASSVNLAEAVEKTHSRYLNNIGRSAEAGTGADFICQAQYDDISNVYVLTVSDGMDGMWQHKLTDKEMGDLCKRHKMRDFVVFFGIVSQSFISGNLEVEVHDTCASLSVSASRTKLRFSKLSAVPHDQLPLARKQLMKQLCHGRGSTAYLEARRELESLKEQQSSTPMTQDGIAAPAFEITERPFKRKAKHSPRKLYANKLNPTVPKRRPPGRRISFDKGPSQESDDDDDDDSA